MPENATGNEHRNTTVTTLAAPGPPRQATRVAAASQQATKSARNQKSFVVGPVRPARVPVVTTAATPTAATGFGSTPLTFYDVRES